MSLSVMTDDSTANRVMQNWNRKVIIVYRSINTNKKTKPKAKLNLKNVTVKATTVNYSINNDSVYMPLNLYEINLPATAMDNITGLVC